MPGPTRRLFIALEPDAALRDLVAGYKDRLRALVGDQLYLSDPPHLTVYLADFPAGFDPLPLLRDVAGGPPPRVRVTGWHTFPGDVLTGRNTLVCALHPNDKRALRRLQTGVVAVLAPHHNPESTAARFGDRLAFLSDEQRRNVAGCGFPFVGDGWEPHVTVASVAENDWPAVWAEFEGRPPAGEFTCRVLRHYDLIDGHPRLRGEVAFTP